MVDGVVLSIRNRVSLLCHSSVPLREAQLCLSPHYVALSVPCEKHSFVCPRTALCCLSPARSIASFVPALHSFVSPLRGAYMSPHYIALFVLHSIYAACNAPGFGFSSNKETNCESPKLKPSTPSCHRPALLERAERWRCPPDQPQHILPRSILPRSAATV